MSTRALAARYNRVLIASSTIIESSLLELPEQLLLEEELPSNIL
jgi:hypothetical protein